MMVVSLNAEQFSRPVFNVHTMTVRLFKYFALTGGASVYKHWQRGASKMARTHLHSAQAQMTLLWKWRLPAHISVVTHWRGRSRLPKHDQIRKYYSPVKGGAFPFSAALTLYWNRLAKFSLPSPTCEVNSLDTRKLQKCVVVLERGL